MDPNTTLRELREGVAALQAERADPQDYATLLEVAEEVAERFAALDAWMSRGGFPPAAWEHPDVSRIVTRVRELNVPTEVGAAHAAAQSELAGLAVDLADACRHRVPADA